MVDQPPQPPKSKIKVRIDSSSSSSQRPVKSEKERKKEQKSLKKINSPKEMKKSAVRGEIYNRARAAEQRGPFGADRTIVKAYTDGGSEGVKKHDKKEAKKTKTEAPSTPFQHKQKAKAEEQKSRAYSDKMFG